VYFERPQEPKGTGVDLQVELKVTDGPPEPFISLKLPFVMDHAP
jgi:hypothetical protein